MISVLLVSQCVLLVTTVILFWVGITDFISFKIRNDLVLTLFFLFLIHAFVSGRWVELHYNFGFAALAFVVILYPYSLKLMGGGDVKLLTVALLWAGPTGAMLYAVFLLGFVLVHVLAIKLATLIWPERGQAHKIPLAPSMAAALVAVFMSGALRPVI